MLSLTERERTVLAAMRDAGTFDAALIYDTDEARGELIAILQDVPTSLRLADPGFLFV